ncbi:CynX/NimT family MFS transporter [Leucobacter sp. NPDC058333]|uniref:CynX/NimT family MFS transporter n=1 Tax=Leucobacter sp. NPDC058333 TaxID=3346450 RepID=UPI0036484BCA
MTVPFDPIDRPSPSRAQILLLAAGLLLIGLNLRIGIASVGPVLTEIRADLGLSATAVSLLTTIPVVAFGAFAFLAPRLIRGFGLHRLLGAAMIAIAAGIAVRLIPDLTALYAGTVLLGAAIAIANVVMPAVIKHDFSRHVGIMMGLYSTTLFIGAAIASGLTVPLLSAVNGNWRGALALWAVPALVAFVVWLPQLRRSEGRVARSSAAADARARVPFSRVLKDPIAIGVTAWMGIQSIGYYATLTWVPTVFQDAGIDARTAGWLLSFSALPGVVGSLVAPIIARRVRPPWVLVIIAVVLIGAGFLGLAISPVEGAYVWMTLLGLGQGAGISLALSYIVWRSPDAQHTGQLSTMAQGFGYLIAGLGPIGIGAIHAATGEWRVPLGVLIGLLVLQAIAGVVASQERHILQRD